MSVRGLAALTRRQVGATALAVSFVSLLAAAPAQAAPSQTSPRKSVSTIEITSSSVSTHETLTIQLDKPITEAQADSIRGRLSNDQTTARSGGAAPTASSSDGPWTTWCYGSAGFPDSNGTFTEDYRCGSPHDILWSWTMNPSVQSIVTSGVTERGLSFWVNGAFKGQNAPHVESAWYQFHGRMNPIWVGNHHYAGNNVDFSDYYTFRVNVGGRTGSGSITLAGSTHLME